MTEGDEDYVFVAVHVNKLGGFEIKVYDHVPVDSTRPVSPDNPDGPWTYLGTTLTKVPVIKGD